MLTRPTALMIVRAHVVCLVRIKLGGHLQSNMLSLAQTLNCSIMLYLLRSCELTLILSLLRDISQPCVCIPIVFCNNLSTTYLAANPVLHSRSKHVEIDYQFVCDKIQNKSLRIQFTTSYTQFTDGLAKPLATQSFTCLRTNISSCFLALKLKGDVIIYVLIYMTWRLLLELDLCCI